MKLLLVTIHLSSIFSYYSNNINDRRCKGLIRLHKVCAFYHKYCQSEKLPLSKMQKEIILLNIIILKGFQLLQTKSYSAKLLRRGSFFS